MQGAALMRHLVHYDKNISHRSFIKLDVITDLEPHLT